MFLRLFSQIATMIPGYKAVCDLLAIFVKLHKYNKNFVTNETLYNPHFI